MAYKELEDLQKLVERLRSKDGCPWDIKQTPTTVSVYLIEEVYELIDAIVSKNADHIKEELGDVLFHIFFISFLFQEKEEFDIKDVAEGIVQKMIRRHPHVFGETKIDSQKQVREQWLSIKKKENNQAIDKSALKSIPKNMPALMRAYKMSEQAADAGFDWNDITGVMKKAVEEWGEFCEEIEKDTLKDNKPQKNRDNTAMEFGDILFTLVNVARFADIHPETSLISAIQKFEKRFRRMEQNVFKKGFKLESFSEVELEELWEEAKESLRKEIDETRL